MRGGADGVRRRAAPRPGVRGSATEAATGAARLMALLGRIDWQVRTSALVPAPPGTPPYSPGAGAGGGFAPPALGWGVCVCVCPAAPGCGSSGGLRCVGGTGHDTPLCAPPRGLGVEVTRKVSRGRGAAAPFVKLCRSRGDNPDRLLQSH